ncbi:hypothetical protein J4E89_006079 [Alternaria sp. Ai002NY15]|nr:hypothetical protein J4E89_006079 [Alternaria sp. Ai002NY15]
MDQCAFLTDMDTAARPAAFGRPRASSNPVFSTSTIHGTHYIDRTSGKRVYIDLNLKTFSKPKGDGWYSHMYANVNADKIVWQGTYEDIYPSSEGVSSTEGYALLCSYSFMDEVMSTISVPGSPPMFKRPNPRDFPLKIAPDSGYHYSDEHAERAPQQQYEPAFQAIATMNPDIRFNDVDVVSNRTTMLNLMKCVKNASFQAFHLDLDFEKNTLFVGRKVRNAKVRSATNTYGRNFESALTESEIDGATTHHRFIKYKLGSLTIVVRHEADAYDPTIESPRDPDAPPSTLPSFVPGERGVNTIQHGGPQKTTVLVQGKVVPQHQILELKSNASSRPIDQMWFGRTPTCCLGGKHNAHFDGTYRQKDIRIKEVTQAGSKSDSFKGFEKWEKGNQEALQKVVTLLQLLRKAVGEDTEHQSAVFVAMSSDDIKVYETKERIGALPKEIVERFWD